MREQREMQHGEVAGLVQHQRTFEAPQPLVVLVIVVLAAQRINKGSCSLMDTQCRTTHPVTDIMQWRAVHQEAIRILDPLCVQGIALAPEHPVKQCRNSQRVAQKTCT